MSDKVIVVIMAVAVFIVSVTFGLWWGLIALGVVFFLHTQLGKPGKDEHGDEG